MNIVDAQVWFVTNATLLPIRSGHSEDAPEGKSESLTPEDAQGAQAEYQTIKS